MQAHPSPYGYLIPIAIVAVIMFFRFRSMGTERRLRLERLWIVPAIYFGVAALMFAQMTPHGLGWLWAGLSLAVGATIGWQRGRAMKISVDPETHALNQISSPLAMILIVILILVRTSLRAATELEGAAWHLDAILITDCLVAFALGLLSATRLEMYLRGSRLLAEARGKRV
jgi:hypothetical protein